VLIGIDIADTAAGAIAGNSLWFNSQKSSSGASYKSFLWSPKLALNRTFLSFQKGSVHRIGCTTGNYLLMQMF
jgi:hypothetical protein